MVEIRTDEELKLWLSDKPNSWAQALATRAALRALPIGVHNFNGSLYTLSLFRVMILSWATINRPSLKTVRSLDTAARATRFSSEKNTIASYCAESANSLAYSISERSISYAVNAVVAASNTMLSEGTLGEEVVDQFWDMISADSKWLSDQENSGLAARALSRRSLWLRQAPLIWRELWKDSLLRLLDREESFAVWGDWFERRIRGENASFDIPGDKYRTEDNRIIGQLVTATNKYFWNNEAKYINNTLQSWIDDARARVSPDAPEKEVPSQNPNAIAFRSNSDGKIAIDTSIPIDGLRTDPDARDRHSELKREALSLLARCQGSNAGARLTRLLDNYVEALGESNEHQRPSLLVQRGNRLDTELKAYSDPATMLSPVADDLLLDLGGLVSVHNMHVMSEPILRDRATAMLGPDAKPVLIPPEEIKAVAQEADEEGILAPGVREIIEEAAEIAPVTPDPESRLTIWSTETVKNLVIEAFLLVKRNKLASVVVTGAVVASPPAVSLGAAYFAANFLIKRREWVESRLGNSPTWKALFIDLCNWWEKNRPPD